MAEAERTQSSAETDTWGRNDVSFSAVEAVVIACLVAALVPAVLLLRDVASELAKRRFEPGYRILAAEQCVMPRWSYRRSSGTSLRRGEPN